MAQVCPRFTGLLRRVVQPRIISHLRPMSLSTTISPPRLVLFRPLVSSFRTSSSVNAELADFLKDEIQAEKNLAREQLQGGDSPTIPGFQVKADEADITLEKTFGKEKVTVRFNVNHTVDVQPTVGPEGESSEPQPAPMLSKPSFSVEIAKGNQKLVFECNFVDTYPDEEGPGAHESDSMDIFNVEEVYLYSGDQSDKVYSMSGEVLDGTLYDHLMTYLEERGIDSNFGNNLIRFATHYEHAQYVALLQKIRDFVSRE